MSNPDEEAEMAKMMGFSGFSSGTKPPPLSGNKKRKLNASPPDDRAAAPRGIPLGNSKGPNPNLIAVPAERAPRQGPAPAGGREGGASAPPPPSQRRDEEQRRQQLLADLSSGVEGNDGVLEKTLEQLTAQDLARLRSGVALADGRTVFFLPSFLEDPWA
jgi:hypothetical protein